MAGAPPPTVPNRRPFDPNTVPPEILQQLSAGQPVPGPNGEVYHPDGTMEDGAPIGAPPGMGPPPADPMMAGMPPPAVGGQGDGDGLQITEDPMEARNPLAGPMFRNFRQTANAGFPGTPGGIGGGPAGGDPLLSGIPAPAVDARPTVMHDPGYSIQGASDRGASMSRVGPDLGGDAQPGRDISYGRRVYTRRQMPQGRMPNSGPFRRPAPDNSPNH